MIQTLYLGRIDYGEALALQQELVELRHQGRIENTLLLLEHPPVLTLGRNATRANILATDAMLARKGVTVFEINRGGDVTYHGPGQLVGYPIFDLRSLTNATGGRLGPVDFVRLMEEALIRLCASYGVLTGRVKGRTGVWTIAPEGTVNSTLREKKIGAIGIHVSRGIVSHGFAFNVATDLRDFQWIIPCGIADREVTSLELEMPNQGDVPTLRQCADVASRCFGQVYGQQILALEDGAAGLAALRAGAVERGDVEQVGVPMRVPAEVDALRHPHVEPSQKPVRA
ncbi:lipoyl(octanoyl) transferase LipB [Acidicapsa dinghuensis]|uniref:Octanoyltransferase n=1 Tax=Acidicapsa dinghuensis TaxID=2218256 RepID=A0ABW1EN45_9BACT|nr:lipoyl(octanoyl) transferase LipB [Acidicapsa dinghuensis]